MATPTFSVPGLLGAAGGLMLGGLGLNAQTQANQQNMQLNRELLDFQKYQYYDQKRYNSIAEQTRRMRAAGLNPALLMQNGMVGTSGSAVGSPSVNPMQPLDFGAVGSSIADMANSFSQQDVNSSIIGKNEADKAKTEADTIAQSIDNLFKYDKEHFGLEKLKAEGFRTGYLAKLAENEVKFANDTLKSRVQQQKIQTEIMANKFEADVLVRGYLPDTISADLSLKLAQEKLAYKMGYASLKTAMANVMDAYTRRAQMSASYGSNPQERSEFFKATMDYLMSGTYENTTWDEGTNIGGKVIGVSHHGRSSHYRSYDEWKKLHGYKY